ncbi:MAG: hypothetical protein DRH06_07385, partial [Deltaproteobacteria bacterium]
GTLAQTGKEVLSGKNLEGFCTSSLSSWQRWTKFGIIVKSFTVLIFHLNSCFCLQQEISP